MGRRWPFPGDWKDTVANVLLVGIAYGLLCLAIGSLFLYGGAAFATSALWLAAHAGARARMLPIAAWERLALHAAAADGARGARQSAQGGGGAAGSQARPSRRLTSPR